MEVLEAAEIFYKKAIDVILPANAAIPIPIDPQTKTYLTLLLQNIEELKTFVDKIVEYSSGKPQTLAIMRTESKTEINNLLNKTKELIDLINLNKSSTDGQSPNLKLNNLTRLYNSFCSTYSNPYKEWLNANKKSNVMMINAFSKLDTVDRKIKELLLNLQKTLSKI